MNVVVVEEVDDLFSKWVEKTEKQSLEFPEDPVTLSCAAWRIGGYPDLDHIKVLDADRELAESVRRHWLNKLTIQRLRGQKPSEFREKLGAFLVGNRKLYKNEIGLLYHLPHFYFEDIAMDELVQTTASVMPSSPERCFVDLTPLRVIDIKRRGGEISQYWWTDPHKRPYCLSIKKDSEHIRLWKSLYSFSGISVNAGLFTKPFMGTDRYYYKMVGVDLLGLK